MVIAVVAQHVSGRCDLLHHLWVVLCELTRQKEVAADVLGLQDLQELVELLLVGDAVVKRDNHLVRCLLASGDDRTLGRVASLRKWKQLLCFHRRGVPGWCAGGLGGSGWGWGRGAAAGHDNNRDQQSEHAVNERHCRTSFVSEMGGNINIL